MLGTTNYCYTQKIKALDLMVSEEDFFMFSYCKSMGDDGRIYLEYHLTLLHTKYTSFRPCGFRKEDF